MSCPGSLEGEVRAPLSQSMAFSTSMEDPSCCWSVLAELWLAACLGPGHCAWILFVWLEPYSEITPLLKTHVSLSLMTSVTSCSIFLGC